MTKPKWIRFLFLSAGAYDAALGLLFLLAPFLAFRWFGVAPPNHAAYVQFPAALLIIFALMFFRIADDPVRNRDLIVYGALLKSSYVGLAFYYQLTQGIPEMWIPWAWIDLAFLVLFLIAWLKTGAIARSGFRPKG
jgi:hypothetical protein